MPGTLKTVLDSFKTISQSADPEHIAAYKVLHENMSYRLPGAASADRMIGFRMLYRTNRLLNTGQKAVVLTDNADSEHALIDSSAKHFKLQLEYLKKQAQTTPSICVNKCSLPSQSSDFEIGSLWQWYRFSMAVA